MKRKIIGALMLLTVVMIIFAMSVLEYGIKTAALLWITIGVITLLVATGAWLLLGN